MHSTATTTTLLLMVSTLLTPTTGFVISSSSSSSKKDEANEWYAPPIQSTTPPATMRRPVKTATRERIITSPEELQNFIHAQDDRLTIVNYHASWCKACARFNLRLDKVKSEHADVVDATTGDVIAQGDIRFASVEWGANEELCQAEGIEKLPTTRFYVNGVLEKEITGGAKKFEQHKDAINYFLQKQQTRNRQSEESLERTLTTGSSLIGQFLPMNTPLLDTSSFA